MIKKYAIVDNTSKNVLNVVSSEVYPNFLTSSGDIIVEVTSNHHHYPSISSKYHAATDEFLHEPGWLMYYDNSTTNSVSLDVMYLTGSVNMTASFNSDLSLVEESDWSTMGGTISNYRWDADNEKSTFTFTTDENLNDGDNILIGVSGTITDAHGYEWSVPHKKRYIYASLIGSGSDIANMAGEGGIQ
jgi:hypothetical protein